MKHPSVQIFGEVLFDHFPDGRQVLGGAPFNVAWHLAGFGVAPRFISAVGTDAAGEWIRASMEDWGLMTSCLQTDPEHPTGSVQVSLIDGEPSYDIVPECAYDFVRAPEDITYPSAPARSRVPIACMFCFQGLTGSFDQRSL